MEMRGEKWGILQPNADVGQRRPLVFGSYAAETFSEPLGVAVLAGALVVPAVTGCLTLRERGSALSAQ